MNACVCNIDQTQSEDYSSDGRISDRLVAPKIYKNKDRGYICIATNATSNGNFLGGHATECTLGSGLKLK
jgi:hypothetical protein